MQVQNMRQRSVPIHNFSMNPRAPVERSSFPIRQPHKTAFSASYLIPIQTEEIHPGDMWQVKIAVKARTAIPIVPVLDNWVMDIHVWFTPYRVLWDNWERFLGAQDNPGDSIAYTIPQLVSTNGGYAVSSVFDYMGLPTAGQITNGAFNVSHSSLPLRAYNRIYNDWYRDQNLQNSLPERTGNTGDTVADYSLVDRGKRFDYFTACLPAPQRGAAVTISLGGTAPIRTSNIAQVTGVQQPMFWRGAASGNRPAAVAPIATDAVGTATTGAVAGFTAPGPTLYPDNLYVDLSTATAVALNTFRVAIATQQLLERDARGGTRYVETVFAHWGVRPPDFRLDRPEYIGGGSIPIIINAIPQTSATGLTGGSTPAGNLAATGYADGSAGYSYAATEHGVIIVLASVRADLSYSQGIRRWWNRQTRYDMVYPEFAHLGEQEVRQKEIYCIGSPTGGLSPGDSDMTVFGYIPRYDECRHFPPMITGIFRPTAAGNTAYWHSSQLFAASPTLNATFISDRTRTTLERNFAAGALTANQQFLCDFLFQGRVARALPTHGTPGLLRF